MGALAERAGVDRVSANSLRYSCAERARRQGADVAELQGQLGHKSIGHTARYVYGEPIARRQTYGAFRPKMSRTFFFAYSCRGTVLCNRGQSTLDQFVIGL